MSLSALSVSSSDSRSFPSLTPFAAICESFDDSSVSNFRRLLVERLSHYAAGSSGDAIGSAITKRYLPITSYDWKFMALLTTAWVVLMTYLVTSVQAALAVRKCKQYRKRPPVLPYWIPFVGHLLEFFWDGPRLTACLVKEFGYLVPAGLRLGPIKMYLLGDPGTVDVFLKPTQAISSNVILPYFMKNVLGMPDYIVPLYSGDNSGHLPKRMPGSIIRPENRIRFLHHKAAHQHLVGTNGIRLGERYMKILGRNISNDTRIGSDWVELPDLWSFIRNLVFSTGTEAMCGSSLLSLNPTFIEDFWAFDQEIPTLMKGLPRWLVPRAYERRDKALSSIRTWHAFANEHSDVSKTGPGDPEWDPFFGIKYVKARQSFLQGIDVMDADGRASEDLGLLFASTNGIVIGFWTAFEVFSRPYLLSLVREIAQSAYDTRAEHAETGNLCKNSLLQSIFAEVTRQRVQGILARSPIGGDLQLGDWCIPEGSILGCASQIGAMNKEIWNAGTEDDPHPLETFWEERFLIYPNNPDSGPLRRQRRASHFREPEPAVHSSNPEKPMGEPTFSTKGLNGAFFPFGGGSGMCPGRHFAKLEVICTLVNLALQYDIELRISKGWEPKMDTNYYPMGALPPKNKVPFRIRRR